MHLIIEGRGRNLQKLKDTEFLRRILDSYPKRIDMEKVSPPQVIEYSNREGGRLEIAGFVLIAESHLSMHILPDEGYINIDVYSCKSFDAGKVIEDLSREFELEKMRIFFFTRDVEHYGKT